MSEFPLSSKLEYERATKKLGGSFMGEERGPGGEVGEVSDYSV